MPKNKFSGSRHSLSAYVNATRGRKAPCFVELCLCLLFQFFFHALLVAVAAVFLGHNHHKDKIGDTCSRECEEQKKYEYYAHCACAKAEMLGKAAAYTCNDLIV